MLLYTCEMVLEVARITLGDLGGFASAGNQRVPSGPLPASFLVGALTGSCAVNAGIHVNEVSAGGLEPSRTFACLSGRLAPCTPLETAPPSLRVSGTVCARHEGGVQARRPQDGRPRRARQGRLRCRGPRRLRATYSLKATYSEGHAWVERGFLREARDPIPRRSRREECSHSLVLRGQRALCHVRPRDETSSVKGPRTRDDRDVKAMPHTLSYTGG